MAELIARHHHSFNRSSFCSIRSMLDEEEYQLLSVLTGHRGHLLPLVILAIGTGMRRGDLFNLKWERVDFQRGLIYVPNSKTGRDYSVPMNEDVRRTLLQLRSTIHGDGHVFINPDTAKPYTDVKKAFGTACRLAAICIGTIYVTRSEPGSLRPTLVKRLLLT